MRASLCLLGLFSVALAPTVARAQEPPAGPERLDEVEAPEYIDEQGMPVYANDTSPEPERLTVAPPRTEPGRFRYCTPHPIPNEAGGGWDASRGEHVRDYPPLDPYLFVERDGCFYFVGDPRDFGYQGETYAYYGSHPVAYDHGGGFCFHVGTHFHLWGPFGPYFMLSDGWWGWAGPLPGWYWWYYPYYHRYWTGYYPRYYGGGRYHRPVGPPDGRGVVARPPTPPRPPLPPPATTPDARGGRTLVLQGFDHRMKVPTHMPATIPGSGQLRRMPIAPGPAAGRAPLYPYGGGKGAQPLPPATRPGIQRMPPAPNAPQGAHPYNYAPRQPYNYAPPRAYPAPGAPPRTYSPPPRTYSPPPSAPPPPRVYAPPAPHPTPAPAPHPAPAPRPHQGGGRHR